MKKEEDQCNICRVDGPIMSRYDQLTLCSCSLMTELSTTQVDDNTSGEFLNAAIEMYPVPDQVALIDSVIVTGFERQAFVSGAMWARIKLLASLRRKRDGRVAESIGL